MSLWNNLPDFLINPALSVDMLKRHLRNFCVCTALKATLQRMINFISSALCRSIIDWLIDCWLICYQEKEEKEANSKKLEEFELLRNKEALLRHQLSRLRQNLTFPCTNFRHQFYHDCPYDSGQAIMFCCWFFFVFFSFSTRNFGGSSADCHQTVPHIRKWVCNLRNFVRHLRGYFLKFGSPIHENSDLILDNFPTWRRII